MTSLNRRVCPRKFWIHTTLPLLEIAHILIHHRVVASVSHDYENVHEWLVCELEGCPIELNVSRKHHDGNVDETEPLVFLLIGNNLPVMTAMVEEIADRVESALQQLYNTWKDRLS